MSEEREQRNQVFGPPSGPITGVDPRIPQVSALDKVKAEFNLDIPVETVPLPSGGKAYPTNHPLHGKETVEIRSMTAREEDVLTNKVYLKKGTVISELIKSCLVDRAVDPVDMLMGDRNALMVAIRITGYGAEYDAEVECANNECGVKAPHQFNLAELPVQRLDIEPVTAGMNLFEFKLPYSQKTIRFRFLTGRNEEEMVATAEKSKKLGLSNEANVTTNLLYSIVSVEGEQDRAKLAGFVRAMPARDSLALRNYIRDHEPGLKMKQETSCPACGNTAEVGMPFGASFLWPSAGR
jgi:hypothetical protein